MAKAKNVASVEVVTPAVETAPAVTARAERSPSVSGPVFEKFILSPEAKAMTAVVAAASLGMNILAFRQRLTGWRRDQKNLVKYLTEHGKTDEAAKVTQVMSSVKLADGRHGRTGQKQELTASQRRMLEFLKAE